MTKQEKTVEETRVEMTQVVLPPHTNSHGTVFGGQVMAWVDICAAVAAQRLCRSPVVTVSFDAVHFIEPIKLGDVVILKAQVNASFRTSMECGVSVESEHPLTGERQKAMKAYATFVSLDDEGNPKPVPRLQQKTETDTRRSENAHRRREQRLKNKD